jgi:hypothetical protein
MAFGDEWRVKVIWPDFCFSFQMREEIRRDGSGKRKTALCGPHLDVSCSGLFLFVE